MPRMTSPLYERQWKYFLREYGMLPADYDRWLEAQNYECAICGTHTEDLPKALAVDHNHRTGNVRGLLCGSCNAGLGMFKDDPERLEEAIRYLRERQ